VAEVLVAGKKRAVAVAAATMNAGSHCLQWVRLKPLLWVLVALEKQLMALVMLVATLLLAL
jgi:uncharacterized membrane protein